MKFIDGKDICAKCGSCCRECWRNLGWFDHGNLPVNFKNSERQRVQPRVFKLLACNGPIHEAVKAMENYYNADHPVIPNVSKELIELSKLLDGAHFDLFDRKGFLRTWGCSIPRKLRSDVCLTYSCMKLDKALKK